MNTKGRLIVVAICLAGIAFVVYEKQYNFVVYLLGVICYLLWSHYKEGTVYLATQAFHRQDYDKTERLLDEIKNPDRLRKGRRNFYEFMMGNIALKKGEVEQAEYHFQLASRLPWKRQYEKGMVLINLANINLGKREYDRVTGYLDVAEQLKLTARQKDIISKIREEVKKNK